MATVSTTLKMVLLTLIPQGTAGDGQRGEPRVFTSVRAA
jgi:hypothetical protein